MKKTKKENQIIIYQTSIGSLEIKADLKEKTIWASQYQIADIFGIERSVVTKHINNILSDRELDKKSVCAKFAQTASDGKSYKINHYNLNINRQCFCFCYILVVFKGTNFYKRC